MADEAARYQCLVGTADHRLFYARLHNEVGQSEQLAAMGAGLLDTEEDYTGLGVIDAEDGQRVYISTPIDPRTGDALAHHELFCGRVATTDGNGPRSPRALGPIIFGHSSSSKPMAASACCGCRALTPPNRLRDSCADLRLLVQLDSIGLITTPLDVIAR